MNNGLIICLIAGEYTLYDPLTKGIHVAKPRGVFRLQGINPKVGDWVVYRIDNKTVTITEVKDRKNDLVRPAICNIDQAFLVFSVKEPDLNLHLLDRFLVILEYSNILPIIVLNKWDLLSEAEKPTVYELMKYYQNIGYKVITTSAKLKLVDQLQQDIAGHVSVITGQSGVGKSSLLNVLDPELTIRTDEISKALGRGKHTTRHVELLRIKEGWIADTPGFGTMDFIDMDETDISHCFVEFFKASTNCKYNGCLHQNEPSCAVKQAVACGHFLKSRYENYSSFVDEVKNQRKW